MCGYHSVGEGAIVIRVTAPCPAALVYRRAVSPSALLLLSTGLMYEKGVLSEPVGSAVS